MSEMVERVARAIAACRINAYGTDEDIARAAIAAMREPTEEMILAFVAEECDQADLFRAYAAMIDAALGEHRA